MKKNLFRRTNKALAVALICLVNLLPGPYLPRVEAASATRYVAASGSDGGSCTSPWSPCKSIQFAIDQSASGDVILVAAGTYTYGVPASACPSWAHAVFCYVDKNLTILGGYTTSNWAERDPDDNLTVIDGQDTYRGVAVIGSAGTNSTYLRMEGFTIQNCLAQGYTYNPGDLDALGGGMWMLIASGELKHIVFKDNQAIGRGTASGDGGEAVGSALRVESAPAGSSIHLEHVTFDNNKSYAGAGSGRGGYAFGALFLNAPSVNIEDTVFTNNYAQGGNSTGTGNGSDGMQGDALGAALGIEWSGSVVLSRVTMTGNNVVGGNAGTTGGGGYGGAVLVEDTNYFYMSDSMVAKNTATGGNAHTGGYSGGGGIQSQNTNEVSLERVSFLSNSSTGGSSIDGGNAASGAGGAMYLFSTKTGSTYHATLENILVADNLAQQGLTGVQGTGNGGGGGIIIHGISADIRHTTFAGNRLGYNMVCGQAMVIQPWSLQSGQLPASVTLSDSIIADHTVGDKYSAAVLVTTNAMLTLNRGLFSGNIKDINSDNKPVDAGSIIGLATMISAGSADFVSPGSPNYNYHLRAASSSEDKATGSTTAQDIDGQGRPFGSASDFGSDEYQPFPLSVSPSDGSLRLDWSKGVGVFSDGVDNYQVVVTCPSGANPPDQGNCGQPIDAGSATTFSLTGLTNHKQYILLIRARDVSGNLVATSTTASAAPTDHLIYIPLVVR